MDKKRVDFEEGLGQIRENGRRGGARSLEITAGELLLWRQCASIGSI